MQDNQSHKPWTARAVPGAGRGRKLLTPTINLALRDVPADLAEGIFACRVMLEYGDGTNDGPFMAAIHYGPRPVFNDTKSFEVHIIDATPKQFPARVTIEIIKRLRDVRDFPSAEVLQEQMGRDIEMTRKILKQ